MNPSTIATLAEPNRFKIIELLRDKPRSVNEVSLLLSLSQPQTSKHLHALNKAGLVKVQPVAQQRYYTLNAEPFIELEDWLSSFHSLWSKRLDNLEEYLTKGDL